MKLCAVCFGLSLVAAVMGRPALAFAEAPSPVKQSSLDAKDGVYGRFDGDVDLDLSLGAEFGSAGTIAPAARGSALYYSIAGLYALGRVRADDASASSLLGLGVDLRPLFVPRWAKGYETGPGFLDLTLDSLSLSLGAFWSAKSREIEAGRGFEAGLGFGLPLFRTAPGLWLEARGTLRYPDAGLRQEALFVAVAWHGFVATPMAASD